LLDFRTFRGENRLKLSSSSHGISLHFRVSLSSSALSINLQCRLSWDFWPLSVFPPAVGPPGLPSPVHPLTGFEPSQRIFASRFASPIKAKSAYRLSPSGVFPAPRSVLLSEPSPFLRLGSFYGRFRYFRPGRRSKDSFLFAVRTLRTPLVRRCDRRCPRGVRLPGDFSFGLPLILPWAWVRARPALRSFSPLASTD
jgi:hypothetical protein